MGRKEKATRRGTKTARAVQGTKGRGKKIKGSRQYPERRAGQGRLGQTQPGSRLEESSHQHQHASGIAQRQQGY